MTAKFLHDYRPPWAVTAWCDDRYIYIELPCTDGPPYIVKNSLTEGGLSKALGLMRDARRKLAKPSVSGDHKFAEQITLDHPKIKRGKTSQTITEAQRSSARNILRKLKMIG